MKCCQCSLLTLNPEEDVNFDSAESANSAHGTSFLACYAFNRMRATVLTALRLKKKV